MILSNARSKPLDPSLPPTEGIPTTAKMGIDATIPEDVPQERYQRIVYFNQEKVSLESYHNGPEVELGLSILFIVVATTYLKLHPFLALVLAYSTIQVIFCLGVRFSAS